MKFNITKSVIIPLGILFCAIADQISKWLVMEYLLKPHSVNNYKPIDFISWFTGYTEQLEFIRIEILPFFNMVMVWNTGISFGMLQSNSLYSVYIMIAIASVIGIGFMIWSFITENKFYIFTAVMICGGALGNIIDRIRFGAVADFLDFHIGKYHWPAFNLADSFITTGVVLMIIYSILFDRKES